MNVMFYSKSGLHVLPAHFRGEKRNLSECGEKNIYQDECIDNNELLSKEILQMFLVPVVGLLITTVTYIGKVTLLSSCSIRSCKLQ